MGSLQDEKLDMINSSSVVDHSGERTDQGKIPSDTEPEDAHRNRGNSCFVLRWNKLSMTALHGRKKALAKPILSEISGSAAAGHLSCILGRSGAGKTSLLSILAGRARASKHLVIDGDVYINNNQVKPWSNGQYNPFEEDRVAYVAQTDVLLPHTTPKEAITFSARMRLPSIISDLDIEEIVRRTLDELDISGVADQYVKVLSGGEARRVSLGLELVTKPKIVLIDEVTSGLDSHNAEMVVDVCRRVAQKRNVVMLMTIHQPNDAIFTLMDRVCILHQGRSLFEGNPGGLESFLSAKSLPVPMGTTPLDWALKTSELYCDGSAYLESLGVFAVEQNDDELSLPRQKDRQTATAPKGRSLPPPKRIGVWIEVKELFKRNIRTVARDSHAAVMKCVSILLLSLLSAFALGGVGKDSLESLSSFTSHVGATFLLLFSCSVTLILKMSECIIQMPTFQREFQTGQYRMMSFALSALLYDITMIFIYASVYILIVFWTIGLQGSFWGWYGCAFLLAIISNLMAYPLTSIPNDPKIGMDLVPLVFTPQLLFSGFIVAPESLPVYVRWLLWLQPLTYGFRLMSYNEFKSCLSRSEEERNLINCAKAWDNTDDAALYTNKTLLTVAQAGKYVGRRNIEEYFGFLNIAEDPHALLWNTCPEAKTQNLKINDAGRGFCDVTFARALRTRMNPTFTRGEWDRTLWLRLVLGRRVRFNLTEDLRSLHIELEDLFIPPPFITALYIDYANSTSLVNGTCRVMEDVCPEVYKANGFSDQGDCIKRMDSLPVATKNSRGLYTVEGNSSGCRHLHASLAVRSPETHCAHLSFTPMDDPDGKVKCSVSEDLSNEDFFSPLDMHLFQAVALETGMNASSSFELVVEDTKNLAECRARSFLDPGGLQSANIFPSNYFCESFLDSQDALGDRNGSYWAALASFLIFFQLLSVVCMRLRAARVS